MKEATVSELFSLENTRAAKLFENAEYPWEVLDKIGSFILELGAELSEEEFDHPSETVWIAKDVSLAPNVSIAGPCIIDAGTELRPSAYIRGNVIVGKNCVVGNSVELKNAVLFDCVQVPHFNYVGDSVLGYKAHMGAGAVTSNIKSDRSDVVIKGAREEIETKRRKVGAMLGDYVEVGCNAVLCPGTVIGKHTTVYPTSCVRGFIPAESIFKSSEKIVVKRK